MLDPRSRLIAVAGATGIIASTPSASFVPFGLYAGLLILLWRTSHVSFRTLSRRCLAGSPIFLLAAAGLLLREEASPEAVRAATAVVLKGFAALSLLVLLSATTSIPQMVWALRKLRAPLVFSLMLTLMGRYVGVILEEYKRLERARDSRTVRPLGQTRWQVYGQQFGTLLLRSLDRSERIHAAMLSRGFEGSWPTAAAPALSWADFGVPFLLLLALGTARSYAFWLR
jgi:cobalt/nickel transport system permease protein